MLHKNIFNLTENKDWKITSESWSISIKDVHSIYYIKPMLPDLSMYESKYITMISKDIIAKIKKIPLSGRHNE